MSRVVSLKRLADSKKPMTDEELQQAQEWIDADWESHDIDRDARNLIQRLLLTISARSE